FADRQLATGRVGDIPLIVRVHEVLRAHVDELQRVQEFGQVGRTVQLQEGVQLPGGSGARVLHAQRDASGLVKADDGPVVAPRDDQRKSGDRAARGYDDDVIEDAATELVDAECLGYRYHRLWLPFVKRRQAARRCGIAADLLLISVGHIDRQRRGGPGAFPAVAQEHAG